MATTASITHLWGLPEMASSSDLVAKSSSTETYGPIEVLTDRWIVHYVARVLAKVPTSETRLRESALIPMYTNVRSLLSTLHSALDTRGVTVPSYPPTAADWAAEATIDVNVLQAAVLPPLEGSVQEYIRFSAGTLSSEVHWSSCVAYLAVMADMYMASILAPPQQVETRVRHAEIVATDEAYARYKEKMTSKEAVESTRVMMEEIMRIRSKPEETGWNEEEAIEVTTGIMRRLWGYFVL